MTATGKIVQVLRRATAREIAVVIRKAHNGIHVRHVDPLRIWSGWIECNAKRSVQAGNENIYLFGLAIRGDSAEDLDIAAIGFSKEDIAIGGGPHETRVVEACRI